MKVLHVTFGVPPIRTGGLAGYCAGLTEAQSRSGQHVAVLYPGRLRGKKTSIRRYLHSGIEYYEIINSLPIALTFGVRAPESYIQSCDSAIYARMLDGFKPDIIHVHSIMGIHAEFFWEAKARDIPIVFTTHDYYPICAKSTFVNSMGQLCDGRTASNCAQCNANAGLSCLQQTLIRERLYCSLRKLARITKAKKKRSNQTPELSGCPNFNSDNSFKKLFDYNDAVFSLFDCVFCNSYIAKNFYKRYYPDIRYEFVPITRKGLVVKPPHCSQDGVVRLGYFGGDKVYKGFETLRNALFYLDEWRFDWRLTLFGGDYPNSTDSRIACFGKYRAEKVQSLMSNLDIVVVPSLYPETFGLVVLEAICSGARIVCSDVVGGSFLVPHSSVFKHGDPRDLAIVIRNTASSNSPVPNLDGYVLDMADHAAIVLAWYEEVSGAVVC